MYAALVAAQIGLDEGDVLAQAVIQSEDDAREYNERIKTLDAELQAVGKMRKVVPGDGGCQYHSLIEAAKLHDQNAGSVMEVPVKVYQQLLDRDWYEPFVEEGYWRFAQGILEKGTCGDDVALQAGVGRQPRHVAGVHSIFSTNISACKHFQPHHSALSWGKG